MTKAGHLRARSHTRLATVPVFILMLALVTPWASAQGGSGLSPAQHHALGVVEDNQALVVDIAKSLWGYAEVGLNEYQSFMKVVSTLKKAGFAVTPSPADVPTAIVATWGSGKPVLGVYEDMDAMPAIGHGCGHNLSTAAGVVAGIAIKETMKAKGIPGTIKLFITPAEEIWDVAPLVAGKGFYEDVDVLIACHSGSENTSEYTSTLAMDHVEYKFKGKAASAAGSAYKGRSALDAVEIFDVAVNFLREHLIPEVRIHYIISDGGAAPNMVPATAAARYFIRGPVYPDVIDARAKVDNCAKGAALATGTELEIGFSSGIYNKVPNKTLAYLGLEAMKVVGGATYTEQDKAEMAALGITEAPRQSIKEPQGGQGYSSNPIGDVTWNTPTSTINIATWTPGTAGHSIESTKQSGAAYGFEGAVFGAKALAVWGINLLTNPEAVAQVRAEFQDKMKGMPPYVGKAMIPEVAYPEAPGFIIASQGQVSVDAAKTAFEEAAGDKIEVLAMSGNKLAEHSVTSAAAGTYGFALSAPVNAGERLKVVYTSADGTFKWFYGYVHAK